MRARVSCCVAFALLVALLPTFSWAEADSPVATPTYLQRPVVVRIEYDTREDLRALAARLDVWEAHPKERYLVALVWPDEFARLQAEGYALRVDLARSAHPDTIPNYPCYRTIAELYEDLEQVVADYPGIAELATIGQSYEDRPLRVIRLTNRAVPGEKPIFFLMANIHGREIITNEAAMSYVENLVESYGVDADVTWLLDHHEIHVLVSANPDGHVKNEPGVPWSWWRKNTHRYGSCYTWNYGVDLNRNYDFKWNSCQGCSSEYPCAYNYRGPSAASEPETVAVQDYVRGLYADRRGPDDADPAAQDTSGVLITLHSYGNLVLWPWGWTEDPPPNSDGYEALGGKLAAYTGYEAYQSTGLYPTDGATDDWAYGELGVASYTFEIGSYEDLFYPPCSRYDALIQPNLSAFLYAAKVARAPYMLAHGPDALAVTVTSTHVLVGGSITLTAQINDEHNGGDEVAHAECYVDTAPWDGGIAIPMEPVDGAYDASAEAAVANLSTSSWSSGRHILYVRGRDAEGNWGPVSATFVQVEWRTLYLPFLVYEEPQPPKESTLPAPARDRALR